MTEHIFGLALFATACFVGSGERYEVCVGTWKAER